MDKATRKFDTLVRFDARVALWSVATTARPHLQICRYSSY